MPFPNRVSRRQPSMIKAPIKGSQEAGEFKRNKEWSDLFLPQIRKILGPALLDAAPVENDRREATDLIVLGMRDLRIGARIRRHHEDRSRLREFTIRKEKMNGASTELDKIARGWCDLMFYGHANKLNLEIEYWILIDLHAWRYHLIQAGLSGGKIDSIDRTAPDGTIFSVFNVDNFPNEPKLIKDSNIE